MSTPLVVLLLTLTIGQPSFAQSYRFESPLGCFSVTLPAEPTSSVELIPTGGKPIEQHSFTLEANGVGVALSFLEVPASLGPGPKTEQEFGALLVASRDGALRAVDGILLRDLPIQVQGYRALDVWAETASGSRAIRARLILAGRRYYQLMLTHPIKSPLPKLAQTVLDTFNLAPAGTCGLG
ncbi:MAG TPA: hypothetical protein VFO67_19885 [Gemmatimonadales bacterium]|nr:hypothetical protein [Gemmatimonadales bacterium]